MHWKCIVSFDKRGRAGEEVKPSHILVVDKEEKLIKQVSRMVAILLFY